MRLCRLQYSDKILLKVMEIERQYVTDEEMCIRSDEQDIAKCLSSGCSFGVFVDGEIVAFSLCYHSDYCTGYVDKCFVMPEYRGRRLQCAMLERNIEALSCCGVDEVFAMVSPKNMASFKSFSRVGFKEKKRMFFSDVERLLLKLEI